MKKEIYIDLGSSTTKVYESISDSVKLIYSLNIPFKQDIEAEKVVKQNRISKLTQIIRKYDHANVKIIATALFREFNQKQQYSIIDQVFDKTGRFIYIIPADLETFYLEKALIGRCDLDEEILLINIGGKSTELVVVKKQQVIQKFNLSIGVGHVINRFQGINDKYSKFTKDEVVKWIQNQIKQNLDPMKIKKAIYSGGELNYMQLTNYPLKPNIYFSDDDHPSMIGFTDFSEYNNDIFSFWAIKKLESRMPSDPKWMHGARGCSALAEAICGLFSIDTIFPSDSNIVHGMHRQEFQIIAICGAHNRQNTRIISELAKKYTIETINLDGSFIDAKTFQNPISSRKNLRRHFLGLKKADALFVLDFDKKCISHIISDIQYFAMENKKIIKYGKTKLPESLSQIPMEYISS